MVAIIKSSHSIHRILNYNENKVKEGVAECIGEGNYPVDHDKMSFNLKLNYLLRQLQLNENVKANSIHISLNFDPSESALDNLKLKDIADQYMEKIGFRDQPYLIYRHYDAGHPHIHLVSIKVRADGSRIDMHNIGRNQSETARKEIENVFGLVKAEGRKTKQHYELQPIALGKISYGKIQSKKAVTAVLEGVLDNYKYASLPELNAVLRQYNVMADRGSENSRIFKGGGLVYRILDEQGNPVGVPIKASDFYSKPTLKYLQEKFKGNETRRMPYKARLKNAIDMALLQKKLSLQELAGLLEKQGIHMALRRNETGILYGITYVDHQTKCVFNGSVLGKQYSAKAIQERCLPTGVSVQDLLPHPAQKQAGQQLQGAPGAAAAKDSEIFSPPASALSKDGTILQELMQSEQANDYLPHELRKDKKRRKKRNLNNNN